MLLSVKHRFLFVHIAKTGGTSVRAALERQRWSDPWYWAMFLCSRLSHASGHRIATKLPRHSKVVAAKELLPKEFFDSLFKFAFVRNPWDLQVSSFHHIRRERPHYLGGHQDFESFLRWKLDPERPYQYHIDTSIELQSDYLIDLRGSVVVDYIGRYERLHDDFATACARIGIPALALPHERQAKDRSKDYRAYYTDDTAELIARHFARDIEILGYRFDPEPSAQLLSRMRWVNDDKGRYYQAHLIEDLFGDWTLITVWGALGSKRGGMRSTAVPSQADGLAIVEQIAKHRSRRGYRLVSG